MFFNVQFCSNQKTQGFFGTCIKSTLSSPKWNVPALWKLASKKDGKETGRLSVSQVGIFASAINLEAQQLKRCFTLNVFQPKTIA